jgi:RsiW-degrading membrane proteinase PrsW (M82 family)
MILEDQTGRLVALAIALTPAIPIALALVGLGRFQKDLVGTAIASGFLAGLVGVMTFVLEKGFKDIEPAWLQALFAAFFLSAIPEELTKYAAVRGIVARHEDAEIGLDLILGSAWVAFGFAVLENMLIVVGLHVTGDQQWGGVALVRAMLAVPSHVATGILMGCCLALASRKPADRARYWRVAAVVLPIMLHALYNAMVFLRATSNAEDRSSLLFVVGLLVLTMVTAALIAGPAVYAIRWAARIPLSGQRDPPAHTGIDRPAVTWSRRSALMALLLISLFLAGAACIGWRSSPFGAVMVAAGAVQAFGFALFVCCGSRAIRRYVEADYVGAAGAR